jgi:HK97 family phage prohead protease
VDLATFERAAAIHDHRRRAEHEAAHAAAAALLGLKVGRVSAPYLSAAEIQAGDPGDAAGSTLIMQPADDDREGWRSMAIAIAAPRLTQPGWPMRWPLTLAPAAGDQADFCDAIKRLDLDRTGYSRLIDGAFELLMSRPYERLRFAVAELLERRHQLSTDEFERVTKAMMEGAKVQHKRLKVIDTEIDEGELLALASTWQVDRVNDRVVRGAYAEAVAKIKAGEHLPLVWQHDINSPLNFVGEVIDADETDEGLRIRARFDLDDDAGRKAYRLVKRGSVTAMSIGYRVLSKRSAPRGVTELLRIDLREVSLVLSPANEGARILAVKTGDEPERLDVLELAERHRVEAFAQEWVGELRACMDAGASAHDADMLRAKSERLARELAPIQIASFEC